MIRFGHGVHFYDEPMRRFGPERRAEPILIIAVMALVGMLIFNAGLGIWSLVDELVATTEAD